MIKTPKLVMIPGPTPVVRSIQDQMGRETVAFGDPDFVRDFRQTVLDLKRLWHCGEGDEAFVVSGSGTLAMDMAVSNLTKRGDSILVCTHGFFGDRFVDFICKGKGVTVDTVKVDWGTCYAVDDVDKALSSKKYAALTITQVDTSTGVISPVREIAEMVRRKHPDVMLIVDAVAAAAGAESRMDWGIDVLFSCSQKAFGVAPGLAILWASSRAIARRRSMEAIPEAYEDFERWIPIMNDPSKYWGTPPVNLIWALKEAVRIIEEEGIEERYARHIRQAAYFVAAMEAIGFRPAAEKGLRAPTLTIFFYPEGIDDVKFRTILAEEGVQSAGCLAHWAGKAFRLGHMGNIDKHTLVSAIASVERACIKCGHNIKPGTALAVLQEGLVKE